jgi:hypothetical protein
VFVRVHMASSRKLGNKHTKEFEDDEEEMPITSSVHSWSLVEGAPLLQLVFESDLYPFASNESSWRYIIAPNMTLFSLIMNQLRFNTLLIGIHSLTGTLKILKKCDINILKLIRAYMGKTLWPRNPRTSTHTL